MKWTSRERECGTSREGRKLKSVEHSAPGLMARNYKTSNALEVEAGWNFSGSGPGSFGGASAWPVAKLHVSFQDTEEAKRDAFVEALKKFCSDYFK